MDDIKSDQKKRSLCYPWYLTSLDFYSKQRCTETVHSRDFLESVDAKIMLDWKSGVSNNLCTKTIHGPQIS
jgi:hypothetical protein